MPFVEAGNQQSAEHCKRSPPKAPPARCHRQSLSPGAKKEEAQQRVTDHMAGFAEQVMPRLKLSRPHTEQEMKNRVKDVASVLSGEVGGGFNGDDDQPQNGGDPDFQEFALMGVQDSRESDAPCLARSAKDEAPG